jgi:hypothetical protein
LCKSEETPLPSEPCAICGSAAVNPLTIAIRYYGEDILHPIAIFDDWECVETLARLRQGKDRPDK